ncbi:MAG: HAD family phosphatase [Pseudomonadota bacterium]
MDMLMAIDLVIFDCDGVLMDSELIASEVELEIYSEFGFQSETKEFAARFAGLNSEDIKARIEEDLGYSLPDRVLGEARNKINERVMSEAPMVEGADLVLDQLDQARCICSNSPPERLKHALTRVGLYDRFRPYVFSAQDTDPPIFKPKPDLFLKTIETFEVSANQAIVIEDSIHGIQGAKAAGCRVVGFTGASHTYTGHADALIDAGAETVINRMQDLPGIVRAFSEWDGLV